MGIFLVLRSTPKNYLAGRVASTEDKGFESHPTVIKYAEKNPGYTHGGSILISYSCVCVCVFCLFTIATELIAVSSTARAIEYPNRRQPGTKRRGTTFSYKGTRDILYITSWICFTTLSLFSTNVKYGQSLLFMIIYGVIYLFLKGKLGTVYHALSALMKFHD